MQPDYWLLMVLLLSIAMIVAGTSRFKIHPFLVLIAASYFVGISAGMQTGRISEVIASGFGSLMAGIGLVIVFGTLIGTVLEKSGAAIKLAEWVIRIIGPRYPALAMSIIGYIVSIPVFCDSAFIILSTLKKNLALKTRKSPLVLSIALATGLYATHTFVPPTPGPIAAAGNLGLNDHLGTVIGFGLVVAFVAALSGYIWSLRLDKSSHEVLPPNDETVTAPTRKLP